MHNTKKALQCVLSFSWNEKKTIKPLFDGTKYAQCFERAHKHKYSTYNNSIHIFPHRLHISFEILWENCTFWLSKYATLWKINRIEWSRYSKSDQTKQRRKNPIANKERLIFCELLQIRSHLACNFTIGWLLFTNFLMGFFVFVHVI